MASDDHVVVLGGGACGMTAAHRLASAGVQVTVLEREPLVGGLCGTHERDGFRFDFGGHRFITDKIEIDRMVRELAGEELLLRRRSSVILNGGRRYRYPLELDDVLRQFGLARGAAATASYAAARTGRVLWPRPERSFEDWVIGRFGRALYDRFFGPYTEKLWGIPPERISSDWAAQRISLLSLTDVLVRLLGLRRGGARTYARRYLYPRLGIGQIFTRMAEGFRAAGGRLRLGARVTGLERGGDGRVDAVRFTDADGEHELDATAVVSTIALPVVARMLSLPPRLRASADALRFRAIRLLNLELQGPEVTPHTWMYVSEPRFSIARIQEPRHRSPAMAPEGCTSLMLEIPCTVGDATWTATEEGLYARCLDELATLGLPPLRQRTIGYFSSYVTEGYPIYHLDYRRDRGRLLAFLDDVPNLVSAGRQGAFRYLFMDAAMEMGLGAADRLLGRTTRHKAPRDEDGLFEARALTA